MSSKTSDSDPSAHPATVEAHSRPDCCIVGGAVSSTVLGIAGRRRRFDEMSLPRFAAWGALGGLLVMVPIMTVLGFSSLSLVVASIMTLLCAGSASGSLALARMAEDRELLYASAGVAEVGLTEEEAQELLGGRG